MLSIGNGILNESISVGNAGRLGEVNHGISIILLGAWVCIRQQSIDTVNACKFDAWLVCEYVATTDELCLRSILLLYQRRLRDSRRDPAIVGQRLEDRLERYVWILCYLPR